jgi:hypothetical protein
MASRQGGTLSGFTPLSTPNAPTDLSVSTSIGSATVSFTAPTDTGDGAVTSFIVTAIDESTGASSWRHRFCFSHHDLPRRRHVQDSRAGGQRLRSGAADGVFDGAGYFFWG